MWKGWNEMKKANEQRDGQIKKLEKQQAKVDEVLRASQQMLQDHKERIRELEMNHKSNNHG